MQKPVWVYMGKDEFGRDLNIYSTGNRATWFGGLAAVVYFCLLMSARFLNAANDEKYRVFFTWPNFKVVFLLVLYFGMFVPWALSPRIMFIYHYLPSLPYLFILLALGLLYFIKFSVRRLNNAYPGKIKNIELIEKII
jgi:dolichyl-phosphate-mannose--protein O-mannosyl transferase